MSNQTNIEAMQTKQLEYLERMEDKEIQRGMWNFSYPVSCRDCKESYTFGCAENARKFVEQHLDHKTRVDTQR